MSRGKRIRIFSFKRVILSIVVGFLCPASFVLTVSLITYFTGRRPSPNVALLVGWPRLIWEVMFDQPRSKADLAPVLLFIATVDTLVYGAITYVILTAVSAVRPKTVTLEPPPTPEEFHPSPLNSD